MNKQQYATKQYKTDYILCFLLLLSWYGYFISFYTFYQEAFFYVDKKASYVVQLLFLVVNDPTSIVAHSGIAFVLFFLQSFLLVSFWSRVRHTKKGTVFLKVCIGSEGVIVIGLLLNILWPLFLVTIIFSATLVYVLLVILKQVGEDGQESNSVEPIIERVDGFLSEEEAICYFDRYMKDWKNDYDKKDSELRYVLYTEKPSTYSLEIYTTTNINTNKEEHS